MIEDGRAVASPSVWTNHKAHNVQGGRLLIVKINKTICSKVERGVTPVKQNTIKQGKCSQMEPGKTE
jgi:hypothetical protein